MKNRTPIISCITLVAALFFNTVMADEITDVMTEASAAYKKGEYVQMKEDLTYVLELLRQKKSENLKIILPDALAGWSAEDAVSETAGTGMLGGGTTISRVYKRENSTVTISLITDSPLMQSIGMMLSNPMFASGGKVKRINREKAMITYQAQQKSGEITLAIDKRFIITTKGTGVTEEELINYTKTIDFNRLKNL